MTPQPGRTGRAGDPRRHIPRTDTVLADPRVVRAAGGAGRTVVKAAVLSAQQQAREGRIAPEDVVTATVSALAAGPRRVINATGVLVHTNLGRAPLSPAAVAAVEAAAGSTDVEFDLVTGGRAGRGRTAMAALGAAVPDAEDVHVVNNNAAALVLAATALAAGREIVISRGEMVEIGAGFRLPELLESTGARLREVGTTNRTTARDYADAVGDATGFVLKVHPSNFRVEGFTASASIADLSALPVPVVVDIGSGLLEPEPLLPEEPDARTALRDGAALVTASGDKLLGGPQAGLILGRADLVRRLRRHPLARALRVDKLTLAALEATLRTDPPIRLALHTAPADLQHRAQALLTRLTPTRPTHCASPADLPNDAPPIDPTDSVEPADSVGHADSSPPTRPAEGAAPAGGARPADGAGSADGAPLSGGAGLADGVGPAEGAGLADGASPSDDAPPARSSRTSDGGGLEVEVVSSVCVVGGGGAPGCELPSVALALPERLALPLRLGDPAVVGRVVGGRLLLDLRSVPPHLDEELARAVLACT
ncbi:L-seryl-tRNA(Sec) selenium transferase [Nonomuraea sp. NPDC049709]|uniref:L-seryl-tRNA(Sec) selenium transferase n=1 Tax=Nonomuraea sp. NPDC049709 TaxID=3154736 RepID=UPI00342A0E7C